MAAHPMASANASLLPSGLWVPSSICPPTAVLCFGGEGPHPQPKGEARIGLKRSRCRSPAGGQFGPAHGEQGRPLGQEREFLADTCETCLLTVKRDTQVGSTRLPHAAVIAARAARTATAGVFPSWSLSQGGEGPQNRDSEAESFSFQSTAGDF